MGEHVHVLRIEQVRAFRGLFDREVLAGAFLFDNRILPAARLRAFAVVAVAAGQIVGEQAASGEGHAHRAVHEAFDVEVVGDAGADVAHGLQVHFAGQHHAARAQFVERVGGLVVGDAGLRAHMQFEVRSHLLGHEHHADVGDDQRVHAGVLQLAEVFAHGFHLVVARQHVEGDVHAGPTLVGVACAFLEILEAQVFRRAAHAERLAAAVDGVRTVIDRGFQSPQIACGGQHFWLVSSLHGCSSYS